MVRTKNEQSPASVREIGKEEAKIGGKIRKLIRAQKLTYNDVAAFLDMTEANVKQMVQGRTAVQWVKLSKIAKLLRTTPNALLGFQSDDESKKRGEG